MSDANQNKNHLKKPSLENLKNLANQNEQNNKSANKTTSDMVTKIDSSNIKSQTPQVLDAENTEPSPTIKNIQDNHHKKNHRHHKKNSLIVAIVFILLLVSLGFNIFNLILLKDGAQDNITNINNLSKRLGLTENEIINLNKPVQSPSEVIQQALESMVIIEKLIPSETMGDIRNFTIDNYIANQVEKEALSNAAPAKELWEQLGSGVILSKSGEILTNKHIIATSGQYRIRTIEGKSYEIERVMVHPYEDLAIVKVKDSLNSNFEPIQIRNTEAQAGEEIYALGHPAKLSFSATKGIVSNPSRNFSMELDDYLQNLRLPEILKRAYFNKSGQSQVLPLFLNNDLANTNFLQHSAAINLGSSGGAIIDTQGNLLGLNTFGIQRQDTETFNLVPNIENPYASVESLNETEEKVTQGFTPGSDFNSNGAIKAETISKIWNDYQSSLANNTEYEVADLGFYAYTFSKSQASLWGLPLEAGLQINKQADKLYNYDLPAINPDGPAKDSGLQEGDIIVSIDEQAIDSQNNLGKILSGKKPNDKIKLEYFRLNNQTKTWEKFDTTYNLGGLKSWNEESLKDLRLGDIQL